MCLLKCFLLSCALASVLSQKTLLKEKSALTPFKRYLDFPEGSSFIATGSFIKRLLFTQENGYYAILGEIDVPFTLPSYSNSKEKISRFSRQHRREIQTNTKELISKFGLDENCFESIFCEMDQYELPNNMQFTKHLLKAIATYFEEHGMRHADKLSCEIVLERCGVAVLPSIVDAFNSDKYTW